MSIKNDKFFNFTLSKYNTDDIIYNELTSNKINLGILSNIYLFDNINNINNINNSIKFICNIGTPTVYFIHNKENQSVDSIFKEQINFRTLKRYDKILNTLLDNPTINYENNLIDLEDYVLKKDGNEDVVLFVDDNPSKILDRIINKDYENKIEVIPIDFYNIRNNLGSYLFKSTYIKNKNIDKNLFYNYNSIQTLYYFDSLYTITNYKYIYNMIKNIFKYKHILDSNIDTTNFSFSPSFLIVNDRASKFYKEINLTNNLGDKRCYNIINKMECNKENIRRLSIFT